MSNERKEPTLSSPNSTLADKRLLPSSTAAKKPINKRPVPPPAKVFVKKEASGLLWFTFLLTLAAISVAAYGFWQSMQSQQIISDQQQRIVDLETQLVLSGDESAQSLTSLAASLKTIKKDTKLSLSEIDKLWATRNVNRKAIADSKKALEVSNDKIQKDLSALEVAVNKPVAALQQRFSEQELLIQSLRERLSDQQQTLKTINAQLKNNASQSELDRLSKELHKKIKAHDEAIQSMDKFRVAVNRDLLTLKQRSASQPAPAPQ